MSLERKTLYPTPDLPGQQVWGLGWWSVFEWAPFRWFWCPLVFENHAALEVLLEAFGRLRECPKTDCRFVYMCVPCMFWRKWNHSLHWGLRSDPNNVKATWLKYWDPALVFPVTTLIYLLDVFHLGIRSLIPGGVPRLSPFLSTLWYWMTCRYQLPTSWSSVEATVSLQRLLAWMS